jgi:hypothetical protein
MKESDIDRPSYTQEDELFNTRSLLIVMGALSKLATRYQPLVSRVILCLAKITREQKLFHPSVVHKATECANLLKFPSIASAILDSPLKIGKKLWPIDEKTPLSFLLDPTGSSSSQSSQRFHAFLP